MSDEPKGDLQFDRADYGEGRPPSLACAACGQAVWGVYYAVNGRVLCERCKTDLELQANQGSRAGRFLRAAGYGVGAGAVGAGIWYAVRATTGYELGLIAVVVGFMVGGAVRKGSNGRGGWRYQTLAMFLTYASIVSAYIPDVVSELKQMAAAHPDGQAAPEPAPGEGAPATGGGGAVAVPSPEPPTPEMSAGQALLAVSVFLAVAFAIACAAPFLGGFQNVMGIVIIGIALYEAWKLNRKVPLEVTGPHRVGTPDEAAAPIEPDRG